MVKANSNTNLKNKIRTLLGETDLNAHSIDEHIVEAIIAEVEQFKIESKIEGRADQFFYDNSLDMHCIAGFDGYFKTLNPRWEQYLGWSTQEMLSKPWIEFVHPDDKESTQNIKSTIVDGKDVYHFENRYICKDGSVKWLSWNSHPDTEKEVMYGVVRDITKLKESEIAARESEERFRVMFENSKDAILLLDIENECFTTANAAWYKMFGFEISSNIQALNPWSISPTKQPNGRNSKEFAREIMQTVLKNGTADYEWKHHRNNNELFDAHVLLVKMTLNGKTMLHCTVRDITETNKNRQELSKSLLETEAVLSAIPDLMFVFNREGVFLSYKALDERILLLPAEQFLNKSVNEVLSPEIAQITQKQLEKVFCTKEIQEYSYTANINDELHYFDARMVLLGADSALTIIRNITKRKNAEMALAESEAKYKMLFESNKDGLAIFSILPNKKLTCFIEFNVAAAEMVGYSKEELKRISPNEIEVNNTTEGMSERVADIDEKGIAEFETQFKHKNGTIIDVEVKAIAIEYKGKPSILNITRNISERKTIERELKESEMRFKALHNASFGGIAIHDKGVIIECNIGLSEMFGYSYEELVGMDGLLLMAVSSRALVMSNILSDMQDPYEAFGVRNDGLEFPICIEARNIPYKGKQVRVVEFRDITQQKKDEQRIIESKLLLDKTQELAKIGGWEWNAVNQKITWTNQVYRIHELENNESMEDFNWIINQSIKCYNESDRDQVLQAFNDCIDKGVAYDLEVPFTSHKGRKSWVKTAAIPIFEKGKVVRVLGHIMDITERRNAELALRKSVEDNRNLVTQMEQGLAVHEGIFDQTGKMIDYRFVFVNPSFEKQTGLIGADIIGKTVLEILPGTELYWIEKYESVVKTGAPLHYENYSKELDRYFEVAAYRNQENQFAVITTDITERHKIEQEIRINNHHINSIFRAAPIGIGVTVDRVIREANPQFFEMIGYSKEEILGQNTQMFYPNFETYQLVGENKYKQIAETGNGTVETQWKRKNGEIIDVLISSTPIIPDQLSQGVTFIATDITKRKCEEKILQAQVRLFEMVETFSKNELILAALNEIENLTSSSISFFHPYNEAKKEVSFGLWSANAIHEFGDLLISQITEYSIDHAGIWADCIRKRKPVIYNDYINLDHKKGLPKNHITINRILTIPIIRNMSVVAVLGVGNKASDYNQSDIEIANRLANLIWEVLERKNAEDQIQKLSVGIEQSPTIVVITDKDGKIEYVNPRFTEITGYTRSEAIGNTPRILYSGHQSKKFYKDLWNTILNGENWTGEMVNKTKSGAFYWESAVISPVKDSSGKLTHFIAIKEDITLRKENDLLLLANERKLKEQNEEYLAINEELTESNYKILNINEELIIARQHAEQSDKLKTAFLANISHEIRTPLNGIIGFTRMLCKPNFDQTKLSYFHQIIKNSSDQLLAIINDVIDIAKIEAGQIDVYEEEVNVNYEIEKALSVFSENARHKEIEIRAELALPDEMSILFTDKGKFNQVINNLINNAVKFTSQGSVTIGYKIVETKIQFYVSDTGIGINKKDQGLIFDRFRQVEIEETRKFGGTGLGLSISKAFVEALGGEIWVQSDAYTGSTFFFSLPYKDVLDSKIPDVLDKNYIVNLQGITVLVAEDEETNKIFMTELIKETHATVLIAQNGVEAVAMAKKHRPNIILMDIKMPEMDGLTATKLIKKEFPEILIVATTAYALSGDKDRFLTAGCDGYLAKPIIKEELMQTINQLVFGKKR